MTLLCLAFSAELSADTLSGTVKDPSGAVVAGAHIEITGESITQTIVLIRMNPESPPRPI